ncbi:MAG: metalloregulator ArsR/SmtB family transcription factor [Anaerolineales bacterium]
MNGHAYLAKVMKELGHPTRLQILEVLKLEGESCVCHLEQRLGLRQAYISQHLARLRKAGLVIDRREGLNVFYGFAHPSIGVLLDVAKDTSFTLAKLEGQPLVFRDVLIYSSKPCPCPKCCTNDVGVERASVEVRDASG